MAIDAAATAVNMTRHWQISPGSYGMLDRWTELNEDELNWRRVEGSPRASASWLAHLVQSGVTLYCTTTHVNHTQQNEILDLNTRQYPEDSGY